MGFDPVYIGYRRTHVFSHVSNSFSTFLFFIAFHLADTQRNENKLLHFKHRVGWKGEIPLAKKSEAKKIPFNFKKEPLSIECKSFINWIEKEKKPISDVNEGLEVLKVLNVAKKKLSKS